MDERKRALLTGLIDYAGLFPPAALPLQEAVHNYRSYREGKHAWILSRFVVPAANAAELPADFPASVIAEDKRHERAGAVEYVEIALDGELPLPPRRAKIRTGGLTPEAYPSVPALAAFLRRAAQARVAFKATAGLHHALPGKTGEGAFTHGFVNVFSAAAMAWRGAGSAELEDGLCDAEGAIARVSAEEVRAARAEFAISFGSCSFEEPVQDLRTMGWL